LHVAYIGKGNPYRNFIENSLENGTVTGYACRRRSKNNEHTKV
jgi:hypothetical protein